MSFVNPLFFLGALAAAVPILLHLIKRERSRKVEFPTLMFLRRISKKTIRYQKLRHLLLLLLRVLAFLLLAFAFTRPFREVPQAAAAPGAVTRADIILLDNSLSMGYGDRWERAREAAAGIARSGGPGDKVALLEFSDRTIVGVPLTSDREAVAGHLEGGVALTDRPTRYAQALKVAEKMALDAGTDRRVLHLISDFQKNGWAGDEQDYQLGGGLLLEAVDVGSAEFSNLAVGDVRVDEIDESAGGGLRIRASVVNYGSRDRKSVRVVVSVDGRPLGDRRVDLPLGEVAPVEFQLPALAAGAHAVVLEVEDEDLTRDNRFAMTVEARGKKPVLAVEVSGSGRGGRSPSFFLSHALNVGSYSPYRLTTLTPQRFDGTDLPQGGLVIWNDAPGGGGATQARLKDFVNRGGGLVVVLGGASKADDFNRTFGSWMPARVVSDRPRSSRRLSDEYALLTDLRMSHPIFEPFGEPHSGSFSNARFFGYARLSVAETGEVLARFDNGDPALVSMSLGKGRALIFASSADDSDNDLPLKSVFAPFWQQMLRYLENFREARRWVEVGDTIEPRSLLAEAALRQGRGGVDTGQSYAVVDPDRQRLNLPAGGDVLTVDRAGFYEIRMPSLTTAVAVNVVPRESDLTHGNAEEMTAGWLSPDAGSAPVISPDERPSPEEQDRRQRLWQFLLLGFLVFLLAEGWLGNQTVLKED